MKKHSIKFNWGSEVWKAIHSFENHIKALGGTVENSPWKGDPVLKYELPEGVPVEEIKFNVAEGTVPKSALNCRSGQVGDHQYEFNAYLQKWVYVGGLERPLVEDSLPEPA